MLELLEKRAGQERLAIETRLMDGHALELDDDTFDMVGSQFGVMLFPDMPKGIREMARVVRPGGSIFVTAYGDPHRIEFLGLLVHAVQRVRPGFDGPPTDPAPLEFQLSHPDSLRRALSAAGLQDIRLEAITETTSFRSGQELWEWIIASNPIVERILRGMLALTDQERATVKKTLERIVRERAGHGDVAELTSPINLGIGTKMR
jgi:SAM-dependent methyltransferase